MIGHLPNGGTIKNVKSLKTLRYDIFIHTLSTAFKTILFTEGVHLSTPSIMHPAWQDRRRRIWQGDSNNHD